MKNSLRYLIPLLGVAAALPAFAADEGKDSSIKERKEMRVIVGPGAEDGGPHRAHRRMVFKGGKPEMETVAFLGVETAPVGPTLAAQLDLAPGIGLVVNNVVPDSPAAAVLKKHDILVKLDDQQLIEPRQFSVLIRNHKEGDEVTLTYVRGGKQTAVKVKLGKNEMPKLAAFGPGEPHMFNLAIPGGGDGQVFSWSEGGPATVGREEVDRMLSLMDGGGMPGLRRFNFTGGEGPGDRTVSVTVNTGDSNMMFSDENGSLELKMADGKKTLVAKDTKGETVFSGPVNTPEERKGLPADVRERLEKIESMHEFSFKTDDDFVPAKVKVLKPTGTKIRLPQRALPTHPATGVF